MIKRDGHWAWAGMSIILSLSATAFCQYEINTSLYLFGFSLIFQIIYRLDGIANTISESKLKIRKEENSNESRSD